MERTKWTDDLLDERLATVDVKVGDLHREVVSLRKDMNIGFADLRAETHAGFADLRAEMHAGFESLASSLRSEIRTDFAGLRAEMATDRAQVAARSRQMLALLGCFMVGLLGLLAAVVAQL